MLRFWIPVALASATGFLFLVLLIVRTAIRSSEPYREGVARAQENSELLAILGSPMQEPFMPFGQIKVNGGYGRANLSITLRGPNGRATVYVRALKSEGEWRYDRIVARTNGREILLS